MISTAFFWQLYQISETLSNSRKHRIASSYRFYVKSELVYRQSHIHYVHECVCAALFKYWQNIKLSAICQ